MNNQYLEVQSKLKNIEDEQKALTNASRANEEVNKEHRGALASYIDKILFYSAATFSFSLALLNLVLSNRIDALRSVGFIIPNIEWLYLSWVLYLISCIAALLNKKFDAYYVANFGMENWTLHQSKFTLLMSNFVKSYPGKIVVEQGVEQYIELGDKNLETLKNAIVENRKKKLLFYNLTRLSFNICEYGALLATLSLFIFAMQLAQKIVW